MTEEFVERSISWNLPEGEYEGTLYEASQYPPHGDPDGKTYFRLAFHVEKPDDEYFDYRAQKRYSMKEEYPKELSKDLERWLGKEFFEQNPNAQWSDVMGRKARLIVKHLHYRGHDKPFVVIAKILPLKAKKKRAPILPRIDVPAEPVEGVNDHANN